MYKNQIIPSVNFHLWEPCNMKCSFCFATFQDVKQSVLPKGHLPKDEAIKVIEAIANYGFEKITFAGGEPTLCPWLSELIQLAKKRGLSTMVVSNGTGINKTFLEENKGYLDWIAISVDSVNAVTNRITGRAMSSDRVLSEDDYRSLMHSIKTFGYRLKVNTVVNSANYSEDLNNFISYAKPERWKVLQALPVEGQNDMTAVDFTVTSKQYESFIRRHKANRYLVKETTDDIINSYVMIDPAGRFFSNETGEHIYSKAINKVGISEAYAEMNYDLEKFKHRGGEYDWKRTESRSSILKNKGSVSGISSFFEYFFAEEKLSEEKTEVLHQKSGYKKPISSRMPFFFHDFFKDDKLGLKQVKPNVTLSGFAGSGKSTIGQLLSKRLSYDFVSVGNYTRSYAEKEFGLTINEFQEKCKQDPSLDREIDERFKMHCNRQEGLVIDYRLGFKVVDNSFKVLLRVSDAAAAKRVSLANRLGESTDALSISKRNKVMRHRFVQQYNVDFADERHYDLVIDTDDKTISEVADIIVEDYVNYCAGTEQSIC